jgi:hypothetical protein
VIGSRFGWLLSVLTVLGLFAVAAAGLGLGRRGDSAVAPTVEAAEVPAGQPVLIVQDERDAGAKEAEPSLYLLWPGQARVYASSSKSMSYIVYDFTRRTVTYQVAEVR